MYKKAITLAKNPLITGSAIIFISSTLANFFHFLFNLFMSRNLSVTDYGTMASLVSLISLTSFFSAALMPTVIKFAAEHFANDDYHKAKVLFSKTTQLSLGLGAVIILLFYVFQMQIAHFFKFAGDSQLVFFTGWVILGGFLLSLNNSFLQAKLAFSYVSFVNLFSAIIKFAFGAVFILLGYRIGGALGALFLASFFAYVISFYPLRFVFNKNTQSSGIELKKLLTFGIPAALCTFALTSFMSTDVILVKHFFDPQQAGLYAGLSLIGKVIFFFSLPIGTTMFPMVVQRYTKKQPYQGLFLLSIMLLLACCIAITLFYIIFPHFSIDFFLKRKEYYVIANLLGLFGGLISLYSLLYLLVNFFLSIKVTKIWIPLVFGAFSQVVLIWNFHQSFFQVIIASMATMSLLLVTLLLYYYFRIHKQSTYA